MADQDDLAKSFLSGGGTSPGGAASTGASAAATPAATPAAVEAAWKRKIQRLAIGFALTSIVSLPLSFSWGSWVFLIPIAFVVLTVREYRRGPRP